MSCDETKDRRVALLGMLNLEYVKAKTVAERIRLEQAIKQTHAEVGADLTRKLYGGLLDVVA